MQKLGYKAIIFDLYGVLALNGWQAFKYVHFHDRPEVWQEVYELGRQVDAGLTDYNDFIQAVASRSNESAAAVRHQLEHTALNQPLLTYIRTELAPQYLLGVLSNASSNKVVDELFSTEDEALFEAILLSHHVGLTKPQTEMYEAIAARLRVEVQECIFVDDQERHVEGARDAGMHALIYTDVERLQRELGKLV
jgi:FMN phosphatase YigB (HAD superfamily)